MESSPETSSSTVAYPRIYRLGRWWRVAYLGMGLFFIGIVAAAWYFDGTTLPDDQTGLFFLLAVFAGVLGMGLYCLACFLFGRPILTLKADSISVRTLFTTRHLKIPEIRGYRVVSQGYSLYEIVLYPNSDTAKPVKISSTIKRDAKLDEWVESLPDLDLIDAESALAELAEDPELGADPQTRLSRVDRARWVARGLNVVSFAVLAWGLFYAQPYWAAIAAAAILPWIAIAMVAIWPQFFRLDAKTEYGRPLLVIPFYLPGFLLALRAIVDYHLFDWWLPLAIAAMAGLGIAIIAALADRGTPTRFGAITLIWLLVFPYGYGVTLAINWRFDSGQAQYFPVMVQGKEASGGGYRNPRTYSVMFGAWGPHEEPNTFGVSKSDYDQLGTRMTVCIGAYRGALHIPVSFISFCPSDFHGGEMDGPVRPGPVARGVAAHWRGDYAAALEFFREPALAGNAEAQFMLGLLYWGGNGVAQDLAEAMRLIRLAAGQQHARAMNTLGYFFDHGIGTPVNAEKAVVWYQRAAKRNEPRAMNNLGILYSDGQKVSRDFEYARELWHRAAEQNHAPAMNNLGNIYAEGVGVEQDWAESERWWQTSADFGNPVAAYSLAQHLYSGDGLPRDVERAINLLTISAGRGWAPAASLLAKLGAGDPKREDDALQSLSRSARRGNVDAMYHLGLILTEREKYEESVDAFRRAAERGHPRAQALLALRYDTGVGLPKDFVEAVKWYRRSAEQGDPLGEERLGYAYDTGSGVGENPLEAEKWYRRAAEQGYAIAQHELGSLYVNGRGVSRDYAKAFRWFRAAAEQGVVQSMNNVGYSLNQGLGVQQNLEEAIIWYRRAAAHGQPNAMHSLAQLYLTGKGLPQDPGEAYYWAILAERAYADRQAQARIAGIRGAAMKELGMDARNAVEMRAAAFKAKPERYNMPPPPEWSPTNEAPPAADNAGQ